MNLELDDPTRPATDAANLPRLYDALSSCYTMASTLWAFAEAMTLAETHKYVRRYANTYGREKPYSEAVKDAGKNDEIIRLQHFADELEDLACRLDALAEALEPVAYPKKGA